MMINFLFEHVYLSLTFFKNILHTFILQFFLVFLLSFFFFNLYIPYQTLLFRPLITSVQNHSIQTCWINLHGVYIYIHMYIYKIITLETDHVIDKHQELGYLIPALIFSICYMQVGQFYKYVVLFNMYFL